MTAASRSTHTLSIIRVSVGKTPILWSTKDSPQDIERLGVPSLIKVQDEDPRLAQQKVNMARQSALEQSDSSWVWLIDADVLPSVSKTKEILKSINQQNFEGFGLIGGTYSSSGDSPLFERSYNTLCNIWSQARGIPLAGNLLIHQELIHTINLNDVPFGQEEYYLADACRKLNLKIKTTAPSLVHKNNKTFGGFWRRSLLHAQVTEVGKSPPPYISYFRLLLKELRRSPQETALVFVYLVLLFSASTLERILKWPLKVCRN